MGHRKRPDLHGYENVRQHRVPPHCSKGRIGHAFEWMKGFEQGSLAAWWTACDRWWTGKANVRTFEIFVNYGTLVHLVVVHFNLSISHELDGNVNISVTTAS